MASFGENLRRERELRGVDLREMAEATKISIRFLQALEQDRVDILPGGIFPKAFVRQYARHLGLDAERLVAEFVYAHGGEPVPPRRASGPVHVDPPRSRGIALAVVALVVLAFVGWKVRGQAGRSATPASPSAPPAPVTTFPHDRVYPPPSGVAASAPPVTPGVMVLTLQARRSSWVEARVDGTTVLNRVLKDGESQRLEARQEVLLSVGNAGGVALTLNDHPLAPIGKDGEVKRNVIIAASNAAALIAGATPPAGPAPSARPVVRPPIAAPAPSPSPSVLVLPLGPATTLPAVPPSPSPRPASPFPPL
jgi:cytoskeletal protein RodZ